MKRKALGRGLEALIPDSEGAPGQSVRMLDVDKIRPNPHQPRMDILKEDLHDLMESLDQNGMIQPIIVSRDEKEFVLIAGERRLRSARHLGWKTVPALIRDISTPAEMIELAIVENIQREDLDPIEEARAYASLCTEFQLTQAEVAQKVGISRAAVANSLRLLKLPDEIQKMLRDGILTAGHARSLLRKKLKSEQLELARKMVGESWSVRKAEKKTDRKKKKPVDPFIYDAQDKLTEYFQTRVEITGSKTRGDIRLRYHSEEELIRLYDKLTGGKHG